MTAILLTTAGSLLWLAIMFVPLERMFPANRAQRTFRPGLFTDLCFFLGQYLLFTWLVLVVMEQLLSPLEGRALGELRTGFAALPLPAQVIIVIMLGDLVAYWGHRAQHRFGFLWRFHAVHHTSTHIDWLAAHREHPLDGLYTQTLVNLPAVFLGFGFAELSGVVAFRSLWAIFIHSNVRLPLGPLEYLLGSPALHHWHHACDRHAGNYANLGPWLDVLFGTHRRPPGEPERLGIDEPLPAGYLGLLLAPLGFRKIGLVSRYFRR